MIEALIAGQRDPMILASLAQGRLKNKSEQLLSVTLNDDEASCWLTMSFGGVVGTVTWSSSFNVTDNISCNC